MQCLKTHVSLGWGVKSVKEMIDAMRWGGARVTGTQTRASNLTKVHFSILATGMTRGWIESLSPRRVIWTGRIHLIVRRRQKRVVDTR